MRKLYTPILILLIVGLSQAVSYAADRPNVFGQKEFFDTSEEDRLREQREREADQRGQQARYNEQRLRDQREQEEHRKEQEKRLQENEKRWQEQKEKEEAEERERRRSPLEKWFRKLKEKQSPKQPIEAPLAPKPEEPYRLTQKIHLKNGKVLDCLVTQKTDQGVWVEVEKGMKVYFENAEIAKVETGQ